jgi:lysophospholipase L1-like esterase
MVMSIKTLNAAEIAQYCHLIGRFTETTIRNQQVLYATNLGATIKFQLNNTSQLTLNFLNNGHSLGPAQIIGVRIDHKHWQKFSVNQMPITIPMSLAGHIIEIMMIGNSDLDGVWTDQQGFAFQSMMVDETATITPVPAQTPVTFIGDSITAGCWLNGLHASVDYGAHQNYVAVCADLLHLDVTRISYSAAGLLRPGMGGVPNALGFLDKLDQQTPFIPPKAQLVVVNIGVNDHAYPREDFTERLITFLTRLQQYYPTTQIMVMISFTQTFAPIFRKIVPTFSNIDIIETKDWRLAYTDGLHPNFKGSQIAGHNLAKVLGQYL